MPVFFSFNNTHEQTKLGPTKNNNNNNSCCEHSTISTDSASRMAICRWKT